jgi:hypothetical protein
MRRSHREGRSIISNGYAMYMSEDINDIEKMDGPTSYKEATKKGKLVKMVVRLWRRRLDL